jgi:S-adenosylmethionine hydrolase
MKRPIVTLTSDFGVQSQGVGMMEGTILDINPECTVIHLMHGLPDYDISCASRTMETIIYMPVGYHVCVVDPGVGAGRKAIIIKTKRGDYLIGPDNGVLISAASMLGGLERAVEITNEKYMRHPVSPIFHGRDVFSPAAAHLSKGVPIEEFGKEIARGKLVKAPYSEAVTKGDSIECQVIHLNKYGSIHLNILHSQWDGFSVSEGQTVTLRFPKKSVDVPFFDTFGRVGEGKSLILKDDYGRVEVAVNMGNFSKKYGIRAGNRCTISKKD